MGCDQNRDIRMKEPIHVQSNTESNNQPKVSIQPKKEKQEVKAIPISNPKPIPKKQSEVNKEPSPLLVSNEKEEPVLLKQEEPNEELEIEELPQENVQNLPDVKAKNANPKEDIEENQNNEVIQENDIPFEFPKEEINEEEPKVENIDELNVEPNIDIKQEEEPKVENTDELNVEPVDIKEEEPKVENTDELNVEPVEINEEEPKVENTDEIYDIQDINEEPKVEEINEEEPKIDDNNQVELPPEENNEIQNESEQPKEEAKQAPNVEQEDSPIPTIDLDKIREETLQRHNELRKIHHAPPLKLNPELNEIAQKYAETIAPLNSMAHSGGMYKDEPLGENIYFSMSTAGPDITGKKMTDAWYSEIADYDFQVGKSKNEKEVRHFTQVVWTDTAEIGVGVASNGNNYFGVANYFPPGNWEGEETQKVIPEDGEAPKVELDVNNKNLQSEGGIKAANKLVDAFNKEAKKDIDIDKIREEALIRHNELRAMHHAPPLKINEELNEIAQKYADKIAAMNQMAHSGDTFHGEFMGENLHFCCNTAGPNITGPKMTDSWYSEIENYDFATGQSSNGKKVGHFTQVVWTDTTDVGFGVGINGNNCYGVANYFPAGNVSGEETQKVLPK